MKHGDWIARLRLREPEAADEITRLEDMAESWRQGCREARAEIERLKAAIAYVRQRSARACEILNEFDATQAR